MKYLTMKLYLATFLLSTVVVFSSCKKDEDTPPSSTMLAEGNEVTMRNTYNDSHVPEISFSAYLDYAFKGSDVEYPQALYADLTEWNGPVVNALYSINFAENTIEYTMLTESDDPFWQNNYRILEEGVKDSYYYTFSGTHNVGSFTCDDPAINLRVESDNLFVIEIGEGFDFNPGAAFTINLVAANSANPAISQANEITMRNTYQENGLPETVYASYLDYAFGSQLGEDGLDETASVVIEGVHYGDDGLDVTATINYSSVEFPEALKADMTGNGGILVNALYSINITNNTFEYILLPDANDPFWITNYRVLEAGVYDRYYLTFKDPHGVTSFTATDPAVNVRIDSDRILVVEIGEGFDFNPGAAFTITLN